MKKIKSARKLIEQKEEEKFYDLKAKINIKDKKN